MFALSAVTVLFCACTLIIQEATSSAIPVWELLSKEEKMSYLYSVFANQVEEFCEFSENKDCNQELLKYGLKKLKALPEDNLDAMDPYQRGASSIIWDSMMEGNALMRTTPKYRTTTTPKPNSYDDNLAFGVDDLGSEASAKIDNVYRVPPPNDFFYITPSTKHPKHSIGSGTPEYKQPPPAASSVKPQQSNNGLPFEDILHPSADIERPLHLYRQEIPLTGPMVVKVYPDGRPVTDIPVSIPQDEDLRQYKLSQIRLPNL